MEPVIIKQRFAAAPDRVFAALADQDAMASWMGGRITIPERGPRGLVGTVRRIHLGPFAFDERIVACEPPRRLAYQVVGRVPFLRRHRGEVTVAADGADAANVSWSIDAEFAPRWVGRVVMSAIVKGLERGLAKLAVRLAEER